MKFHENLKAMLSEHSQKVELVQWAMISGISSLVYSEYLLRIKQKQHPTTVMLFPPLKAVTELLDPNGPLISKLSESYIDDIVKSRLFQQVKDAPELLLFNDENLEMLKVVFDLYIVPNLQRRLPQTIQKKFMIGDPSNQLIREDYEIDLFHRNPITPNQYMFIVDQTILQLLLLMPSMKKSVELPEVNYNINMTDMEILTITHDNAICPIHFNKEIIENEEVMNVLTFITNTQIKKLDYSGQSNVPVKEILGVHEAIEYEVKSNTFNRVALTVLEGLYVQEENTEDGAE